MNVLETARDSLSPKMEITNNTIFETELNEYREATKDNQSSLCETEFTYRELCLRNCPEYSNRRKLFIVK